MRSIITPRKALNKAYLKIKPSRSEIEVFKENLIQLLDQINDKESEEFHKNIVSNFLKKTYYEPEYFINTKGRNDLVIHNNKSATDTVGVIIEAKRATNSSEMLKQDSINTKGMQELVLYYLRERITNKNLEVKHLIATNIYEWFIFDATVFEKHFAQNKKLVQQYEDFVAGILSGTRTDFFYKNIAEPAIGAVENAIEYVYFNISDVECALKNSERGDDAKLIPLFKLLSPQHLLKAAFVNDSNTLNRSFYTELLHIIGLEETKDGSKKLIARKKQGKRHSGALIENAILQLESLDKLDRLGNRMQYGELKDEQLFNVAIELAITWVNRVLFLKLLEAQLITYHKGDKSYEFLNIGRIKDFDELNTLFFQVLAVKSDDRNEDVKTKFSKVPYLNSSLFEVSDIEQDTIVISNLSDDKKLPILSSTVLKDKQGKKISTELTAIEYLFGFLDAYDYASDGKDEIQEDNKTLINASVLGLIFEKINGYKDGSFFTPGFITMYMCRETIRHAVIQKINDVKGWKCKDLNELYNKIEDKDKTEINSIINNLKICDPAVGSGHFLVSALNEIIALKSDLEILQTCDGRRLKNYKIEVVNDELIITDEDGDFFEYNPANDESFRVQKTLFHEKQTIIENCLFGVDINPNSVKICRLRLWIELLKNAYYNPNQQLETLPNIDINIKIGNSLISRFPLDADLGRALKKSNFTIDSYKQAVVTYRNAESKDQKREMEALIKKIKNDFRAEILYHDPKAKKLVHLGAELKALELPQTLLEESVPEKNDREQKLQKLKIKFNKLNAEIEEIKGNKIYVDAFEWRFEFPEVLSDDGAFLGFDVVFGNPPYGVSITGKYREYLVAVIGKVPDYEIYYWFINRGAELLRHHGKLAYIIPNSIIFNVYAQTYRMQLFDNWGIDEILDCTEFDIFPDATVRNVIISLSKGVADNKLGYRETGNAKSFQELVSRPTVLIDKTMVETNKQNWGLIFKLSADVLELVGKIKKACIPLAEYFPETSQGLIAYDKHAGQSDETIRNKIFHSVDKKSASYKPWLHGEDVTRYGVQWNGKEYINYGGGIANPRNPKFFYRERILVREITNPRIYAAHTSSEFYNDPSIIIILDNAAKKGLGILTLLGILNSKLATFYHFNSSPKATKGAFPKILICDINTFPLPGNLEHGTHSEIRKKVELILSTKKHDPNADTSTLETEIDHLVFTLYDLTPEEIALVEEVS